MAGSPALDRPASVTTPAKSHADSPSSQVELDEARGEPGARHPAGREQEEQGRVGRRR